MTEQQESETKSSSSSQSTKRPSSTSKESPDRSTSRESSDQETATRRRPKSKTSQTTTKRRPKPKLAAGKAVVAAIKQLQLLTTRAPESVVGVRAHDDGWRVTVEVVESARIPNTADIMAEYEVDIDANGDLAGYSRKSRYFRGRTQGE